MVLSKKIPLRIAWYGLIILASMLPAAALSPWLYQQAHTLLLDRAMLSERMFHQTIAMRLQLETKRLISVLRNKADPIAYFVSRHRNIDFMRQLLEKINQREPLLNTTTIYDRHANILLSAHHGEHMPAFIDRTVPAFAIPMHKRVFIGPPVHLSDKHLEFLIAVPLIADNKAVGVMISTINVDAFWRNIRANAPEHNSKIYLIDGRGSLLTPLPDSKYQQGALLSDREMVRALMSGKDWYRPDVYEGFDGRKVFGIATLVHNLRWGIISEIPSVSIDSPITSILITLTLIVVILHVLFGMISLMFTKRLLNPVSELATAVKRATQGDYEHKLRPSRYREIDDLTASFSAMIYEIEKREFSLRQIIDTARDAFIQMNADGIIIAWNPEAEKIFGWSSEQVIGRMVEDTIIPPEHRSAHAQGLKEFLASGKKGVIAKQFVEITGIHADEHIFPIEITVVPVRAGGTQTFNAFIRDISVRKQAEAQLRKLSRAVEQAGESIVITDKDGVIEYVNTAFTRINGYTAEKVIGKTPRILKSGKQNVAFYKGMWDTILTGKVWQSKIINRKKDGTLYPVMLTISPICNDTGEITHFVAVHADLTEHDEMQARFEQAQKMEAVGTLVGGIAHNFNNMLAGITGNLYLMRSKMQGMPELVDRVRRVEGLTHQAADMISELLVFARKGTVEKNDVDLAVFLKEAYKLTAVTLPSNIKVTQEFTNGTLPVHGDANQIQQVMLNLLNNARDAVANMDEPEIRICLERYEADRGFLKGYSGNGRHAFREGQAFARFSVSDNGCGIPKEQLSDIFDPFFTTKEVGMGTGLGLAMSYGAVHEHGGVLDVESEVGKGTVFSVYLPLVQPQATTVKAPDEKPVIHGRGETILLADDERHVRETVAEVLETMGYKVLQAKDGREAMRIFKTNQDEITLAILDVVMPHYGGIQLAERIRKMSSDIPVIFMTGYDNEQVLGSIEQPRNSKILTKPVQFEDLSHSIRQMLD
ncbi:MAG: PAS domain S-box protein [Mariprofundaceae bacterium]|nr:PAS domain S-box protein [Mariprofundaceae bacterium]